MNVQTQQDAKDVKTSCPAGLKPRELNTSKGKDPNVPNKTSRDNPNLYSSFITPADVLYSRVVTQVQVSEDSQVPISSLINNKINVTMQNMSIQGGIRKTI